MASQAPRKLRSLLQRATALVIAVAICSSLIILSSHDPEQALGGAGANLGDYWEADQRSASLPALEGPSVVVAHQLPESRATLSGRDTELDWPRSRTLAEPAHTADRIPPGNVKDESGHELAGASASPALSGTHFEGLDSDDNAETSLAAPDSQLAVGPDHVVEMVTSTARIFDKSGNQQQTFALEDFFGVPAGNIHGAPKLIFDANSGRWFAAYLSYDDNIFGTDEGFLHLAVSQTDDPTAAWLTYHLPFLELYPDDPRIGVTNDKVTLTGNLFDIDGTLGDITADCLVDTGFCGSWGEVLEKADLLAGVPADDVGEFVFRDMEFFSVRPAQMLSATSDQYLTAFSLAEWDLLHVIKVTGTPNEKNVDSFVTDLQVIDQFPPPPSLTAGEGSCVIVEQDLGSPPCIYSGDARMLNAVWRENSLWSAATAECVWPPDMTPRSCLHLIEIATEGTPSVVQDSLFGADGLYASWPAIMTDASNNLIVSFNRTSVETLADARIAGRQAVDPPGTLSNSIALRTGEVVHVSGFWGNDVNAAIDPSNQDCPWLVGQYAKETEVADWGTYIGAASFSGGCSGEPAVTSTPVATTTPTASATHTPTASPTPTPTETPEPAILVGDSNCDGTVNAVDATFILQFTAGLLETLPCANAGDANQDGTLNPLDAALILQVSAGLLDGLPA